MNWQRPMRDRCAHSAMIGAMIASSMCAAQPADWFVDADGGGTGWWSDAYTSLQDVLQHDDLADGDIIWVAAGTYYPTDTTDRDASFELVNNVGLYGGFAGTEELLKEQDIFSNPTTLSGNIGLPEDDSDNSYHVVVSAWHDADTRIDGFRITHGRADGAWGKGKGGGMLLRTTEAAVVRCTFFCNKAGAAGSSSGQGGAIANVYEYAPPELFPYEDGPTLVNCDVSGSYAHEGAGMYNGPRALARIWNSGFHHNYTRSGGEGGGIYAEPGVVIELRSCTIAKNDSTPDDGEGGGLYLTGTPSWPTSADIANCVIWGNTDSTTDPQAEQITLGSSYSTLDINYTCVEGWTGAWGGEGCHGQDPLFIDPNGVGDFRLSSVASPCVDAGDNDSLPADAYDLDNDENEGEAVPYDLYLSRRQSRTLVDMGAYEYCVADINVDRVVDVVDLLALLEAWGDCPDPPAACPADIDGSGHQPDGVVDVVDLLLLLTEWGCGVPGGEPAPEDVCDCIQRYGDNIERLMACIEAIILSQGGE